MTHFQENLNYLVFFWFDRDSNKGTLVYEANVVPLRHEKKGNCEKKSCVYKAQAVFLS